MVARGGWERVGRGVDWEGGSSGEVGSEELGVEGDDGSGGESGHGRGGGGGWAGRRSGMEEFDDKMGNLLVDASEGVDRIRPNSDSDEDWTTLKKAVLVVEPRQS